MDVHLLVYDLSNGLAKQLSMSMLGFQLDAIYHTSIELEGVEYVYDSGINTIRPGTSHLGRPLERIHLGETQLPIEIVLEYLDSLKQIYTPEAYDLFRHNCNNFSHDFATFLVGKGIPDHIKNMPQAVLDSPFGRMLQPQLEQMVQARKAQQGGLLGIQANAQTPPAHNGSAAATAAKPAASSVVRHAASLPELNALLQAARGSAAVVFFTSATCPPCKALYPLYDQLAAEWGHQVTLIKVDTSRAFDVAQHYAIRGTPTFLSFFHGQRQEHWVGADGARLRGTVQLLAQMAHPAHPHLSLRLPHFAGPAAAQHAANPTVYAKVPPLPKLLSKLAGPAIAVDSDPAVQGLKRFIELRAAEGPVDAPLPPDMPAIARFLRSAVADLPRDVLFAAVDLFRCALADPRFSGYLAEEPGHATVVAVLDAVNGCAAAADCPYALRLVTLQMACNLFSSPLYAEQVLAPAATALREPLMRLLTSSFLDEGHSSVRVAAASLLVNIASASASAAASAASNGNSNSNHGKALPESEQVELAASVLEAIGQEGASGEALHGMLLGLGFLAYRAPLDGELADLLRVLDARDTVLAKKARFPDEPLVEEVGSELLGKGLAKP
ncbi:hypothetical protein SLS62_009849 [Diatrype stigma]|uniref:Thioredoxin n=1 Tax=Diatrype stigma TaxID=117547 RepID=A0AAN9YK08_9PEZI